MIDVESWNWTDEEAADLADQGGEELFTALLERMIRGAPVSVAIGHLEAAADALGRALSIERPPVPRPYAQLAEALALLGLYEHQRNPEAHIRGFYEGAVKALGEATARYDSAVNWQPDLRHDVHASVAALALLCRDVDRARHEVKEAARFLSAGSVLGELAQAVERGVASLDAR